MIVTISATVQESQIEAKRNLGVSWRFLIGKGIEHMRECAPREQTLREQYGEAIRHRQYLRAIHFIKEKYPKIWEEIIMSGETEVV